MEINRLDARFGAEVTGLDEEACAATVLNGPAYDPTNHRIRSAAGGNTEFTNLFLAYDALDDATKRTLRGRRGFHAYLSRRAPRKLLTRTEEEEGSLRWRHNVPSAPERRHHGGLRPLRSPSPAGTARYLRTEAPARSDPEGTRRPVLRADDGHRLRQEPRLDRAVVDHVLRRGSGRGIQAIVVYPMNALANSQIPKRLFDTAQRRMKEVRTDE